MKFKLVTLTPDDANDWLGRNYESNRKVINSHVRLLAEEMKCGNFDSMNGQTIVIDRNEVLYDGQHRLAAQAIAGVTLTWLVVIVENGEDAFKTIDQNKTRKTSDFFVGFKNRTVSSSIAGFGFCLDEREMPLLSAIQSKQSHKVHVSRINATNYGFEHKDTIEKLASYAEQMRSSIGVGSTKIYGCFCFLLEYVNRDESLEDFLDDLHNQVPDCKTLIVLKQKILNSYTKTSRPSPAWLLGTLLDAYEHFMLMDDSVTLNKSVSRIKQYEKHIERTRSQKHDRENKSGAA